MQSPKSDSQRTLRVRRRSLSALLEGARGAHKRGKERAPVGKEWEVAAGQRKARGLGFAGSMGVAGVWVDDNIQLCGSVGGQWEAWEGARGGGW